MNSNWMMNKRLKDKPYVPTEAEHIANIFTHAVSQRIRAGRSL